jgi:hypothetical protein
MLSALRNVKERGTVVINAIYFALDVKMEK